jgi:endonuclease/exonuclease/phosphatase family metal-dependent hydrolase
MKYLLIIYFACSSFGFAQVYSVMSYNIKLDYPKEGENSWISRKPFFINQLKFYDPDVLGVQEAMPNQMKDIDSLMLPYSFVGVGREDGKDEGEYSAIFYKTEKFKMIKSSTFWLSETPEQVSMGWDAACNRVCTYTLLEAKVTGEKFWVFNTHFDHVGKQARINSATLIMDKIKAINEDHYPVILTGDFNMEVTHESIKHIKSTLKDSKEVAQLTFGPEGTFNGFNFNQPVTKRIDYIFVSKAIEVHKSAVLSDNWDGKFPSDHLPVYIEFNLTNQ